MVKLKEEVQGQDDNRGKADSGSELGRILVDTVNIKQEVTQENVAQNKELQKKDTQDKITQMKGTKSNASEGKTNNSGNSSDADEFVDSYSTNLITKKDIPQDVAIAIQALGDLKKSTKIINNIKKNANFVLENSKIHLNKNIQDIHTFKKITNKVVKKNFGSRRDRRKRQLIMDDKEDGEDEDEEEESRGKEEKEEEEREGEEDLEEDHTEEYYSGEEDNQEDALEQRLDDQTGRPNTPSTQTTKKRSKRRRISQALKSHKLNLSIESKKKLFTCLHLLKLANRQLSNKVTGLQILVQNEENLRSGRNTSEANVSGVNANALTSGASAPSTSSLSTMSPSTSAKNEIVGTVKKVYTLISKYTGNSLPEPARSKVRESLLKLPTKLQTYMSNDIEDDDIEEDDNNEEEIKEYTPTHDPTTVKIKQEDVESLPLEISSSLPKKRSHRVLKKVSKNKKMLLLAKESLEMVSSVMDVVDETLGKAEEWVKHKQEIKELLRKNLQQGVANGPAKMILGPGAIKTDLPELQRITGPATENSTTNDNNKNNNIHK
ncbi:hypothetical protein ACO0QE_001940 [Hanseniaspora vineae]